MNRFITSAILVIMFAASTTAKFSFGLNMTYSVERTTTLQETYTSKSEVTRSYSSIGVQPFVGIFPNDLIEISPFIGFFNSSNSTEYKDSDNETSTSQNSIAIGCGLYFHFVRGSVFDVSVGPQIGYQPFFEPNNEPQDTEYDTYYRANLWISCPLNIDLHFTKHFSARLYTDLIRYNNYNFTTEIENGNETDTHTDKFDFKSIFQPSFGLYFTF